MPLALPIVLPCAMDSALKVLQYYADAPLEEAKRTVDLATLIVLGRRGEPDDRTQDPALKQHRREAGTVRAYAAQILRENGKPLPISMIRTTLNRRFQINSSLESVSSMLSRLAKKGDEFTRPSKGLYGLVEWTQQDEQDDG